MELSELLKKSAALAKFQVSAVIKQQHDNPVMHQREKFIEAINTQLEALEAEVAGKPFIKTGKRKDKETGEVGEKQLRFKKWYSKNGSRYVIVLRYGASPLFKEGIIAPTLDDVHKVLDGMIDAAKAGHLDSQFANFMRGKRENKDDVKAARNIKPH